MKTPKVYIIFGIILAITNLLAWKSVAAAEKILVPTDSTKTIKLGKQGLFISNLPTYVRFVEIEKLKPPLRAEYTYKVDISYRGPALDITFLNDRMASVTPTPTLTSIYFNISEPELTMWNEGGVEKIGIWFYNKKSEEWRLCHPRLIEEKQHNGKYDRLACFVMGNGIYILGKMENDPFFPLWFKPHTKGKDNWMIIQDY